MGVWSCLFVLLVSLKLPEIEYRDYDKFLLRAKGVHDLLDPEVTLALELVVATVILTCCFMVLVVYVCYIRKVRKARGSPLQNSTLDKSMSLSPVKNNFEVVGILETSISDLFLEEGQDSPDSEDLPSTTTDKFTPSSKMSIQFVNSENTTSNSTESPKSPRTLKRHNYIRRHKSVRLQFRAKIKIYTISKSKFSHKVPVPVFRIQLLNDVLLEGNCVEISAQHVSVYGEEGQPEISDMPLPDCSDDEIPLCLPSRLRRRKRAT